MRDVFLDAVIPIIETYRLLQGAYASNVVKLDGGHKVHIRLPMQATIHASMAVHSLQYIQPLHASTSGGLEWYYHHGGWGGHHHALMDWNSLLLGNRPMLDSCFSSVPRAWKGKLKINKVYPKHHSP